VQELALDQRALDLRGDPGQRQRGQRGPGRDADRALGPAGKVPEQRRIRIPRALEQRLHDSLRPEREAAAEGQQRPRVEHVDEHVLDVLLVPGHDRGGAALHERLVPYVRAAAACAARSGVPVIRPLCLLDPDAPRGWEISDAYFFGPSLWVAPVVEEGARAREVPLPRGKWIDFWTGAPVVGGGSVVADAPLARIPVFVRAGSILVAYPPETVAGGLGDAPEASRSLSVSLWGRPACGRTGVRLADETRIRWRQGAWSVTPEGACRFLANSL
jgi:hypothetical protein